MEALAPDASSAKAGRGLATASHWGLLGGDETAAWGECRGSGSRPYQVRIDLREPAFKCSCPSRKFPCKHGLALFFLLVEQPDQFRERSRPAWVEEWLTSRDKRATKRAARADVGDRAPDPEAQAKRRAKRASLVDGGVAHLQVWLDDLLANGLGAAQSQPISYWEGAAAGMVDAQAPALAREVRAAASIAHSGEGWQSRLLTHLGAIQLTLDGWRRLEHLPADLRAEVRTRVGFTVDQDELGALAGERDRWWVGGQQVRDEDRLRVRRTWLWGCESNAPALILDFAAGGKPFEGAYAVGSSIDAEVVRYPGVSRLRASVRAVTDTIPAASPAAGYATLGEAADAMSRRVATSPWERGVPILCRDVRPRRTGVGRWEVVDEAGGVADLGPRGSEHWELLSISGGTAVTLFGEWDGQHLEPLSVHREGRTWSLA